VTLAGLVLKRKNLLSSIKKTVEEYQPDVIGLSAMTFQFKTARIVPSVFDREGVYCKYLDMILFWVNKILFRLL